MNTLGVLVPGWGRGTLDWSGGAALVCIGQVR